MQTSWICVQQTLQDQPALSYLIPSKILEALLVPALPRILVIFVRTYELNRQEHKGNQIRRDSARACDKQVFSLPSPHF